MNNPTKIFDIKNKNIVLTGATGTLGSQYSDFLSAAGANLILIDLEKKSNEKLEKKIHKKYGTNCKSYVADISNKSEIKKMLDLHQNLRKRKQNLIPLHLKNFLLTYGIKLSQSILLEYFYALKSLDGKWLNKKMVLL